MNEFMGNAPIKSAQTETEISRAAQEVQASLVIAKKFPRDEMSAYNRIMKSCERKNLADAAIYEYPRGGQKVSGPSIRLAETIAQSWGNISFGINEIEQRNGESTVQAFAWDLETNTRREIKFQVPHTRDTKEKGKKTLTDSRDIYEMVANQGARRLRACILAVIPGDIIDAAVDQCEKTMKNGEKEPLSDRIRKMVCVFSSEFHISQKMIEARFGHNVDALSESEMVTLKKIYRSMKDGMSDIDDHFERAENSAVKVSPFEKPAANPATAKESLEVPPEPENQAPPLAEKKPATKTLAELFPPACPVTAKDAEAYFRAMKQLPAKAELAKNAALMAILSEDKDNIYDKIIAWASQKPSLPGMSGELLSQRD